MWVGVCDDGLGDSGYQWVWVWVGVCNDGLGDSGYQWVCGCGWECVMMVWVIVGTSGCVGVGGSV